MTYQDPPSPRRQEVRRFESPDSSNVAWIAWTQPLDGEPRLQVAFKNASIYRYPGVPEDVYLQLRDAASVGALFDKLVKKGPYVAERIAGAEPVAEVLPAS